MRVVVKRHMQQYFSYICDGTQMCRQIVEEVGTYMYGRALNAIDIA